MNFKKRNKNNKKTTRNINKKRSKRTNKAPEVKTIDYNFVTKHRDDLEYRFKPLVIGHTGIDHDYVMVLVTATGQVDFNTSVRYLDGVPKRIGEQMRYMKTDNYQGLIFGRPGHIMHKKYLPIYNNLYGVYQTMMIKSFRLLNSNIAYWESPASKPAMLKYLTEFVEEVTNKVQLVESMNMSKRKAAIYTNYFEIEHKPFGKIPQELI